MLFLWRDKKSPLLVPLSCLAYKMIHSRILCKPPSELRVARCAQAARSAARLLRIRTGFHMPRRFVPRRSAEDSNVYRWTTPEPTASPFRLSSSA